MRDVRGLALRPAAEARRLAEVARGAAVLAAAPGVHVLTCGPTTGPMGLVRSDGSLTPAGQVLADRYRVEKKFFALSIVYLFLHFCLFLAEAGLLPREQIYIQQAGGVLGAHAGPGALGIAALLK